MALSPTADVRAAPPHRRGEFHTIVVPIVSDGVAARRAVEAAARVSSRKATIVLVYVLEVPRELPLDALFADEEEDARRVLRQTASVVEAYGIHAVQRVERAHDAAPMVLAIAGEYGADMIVVGTRSRTRRGRSAFGPTATAILHRATCRVLVVSRPAQAARR